MFSRLFPKLKLSLLYLFITALIGAYLRFMFIYDPGIINYQNLLHSHSHTAILGWIYNAFYLAILISCLPNEINSRKYNNIFWLTQIAVIGMTISFALQGYAAISISFSTMHILLSYLFIYCFVKDIRKNNSANGLISLKFIYGGLFFMFLSSFGPWGLVVIAVKGLSESEIYKQAIYFYLHFQYNGFFIFTLIGLWLSNIERSLSDSGKKNLNLSFILLFAANIPAYFLSLLGFNVNIIIWLIAILSALVQLTGIRKLFITLFSTENILFINNNLWAKNLFRLSLLCLLLKFILQLVSALPGAGEPAFISREVLIAYIHLVMLGVVTPGLFGWLGHNNLFALDSNLNVPGIKIYVTGFILSGLLLFYPSLVIWFRMPAIPLYSVLLFFSSVLLLAGVLLIFISLRKRNLDTRQSL